MAHQELAPGHFHHFEPEQAYHASKMGMWLFIATEIHLFSGLFVAFAFFRMRHHDVFVQSAHQLDWKLGAVNTLVLLISSWTMVRAVDAAQRGLNKNCAFWLHGTWILAVAFFGIKAIEYTTKFSHGIYPSNNIFWGLYFTMTGIHGVHVLVGVFLIWWLVALAKKNRFSENYYTPVEICGLYWHLVDLVWIFLFPIVYLLSGLDLSGGAHH